MSGVIERKGHKVLRINGVEDHVHLLIGLRPQEALSDLMREVKKASNKWIRDKGYVRNFYWQEGYGAFAVSKSHVDKVIDYIKEQETHHAKRSFKSEYKAFLDKHEISYEDAYLFDWIEEEKT